VPEGDAIHSAARLIRVGHKGAHHIAPGNTIDSFEAALEHGVDMIEFDVLRTRDGRLVLAHDYADADSRDCLSLEEGLDHFAGEAYTGIELDVDMKLPGYEREVAEGLLERGLGERSLISSHYTESLDLLGEIAPGLRRGWSVPRGQASARIEAGGCEAIMSNRLLVSARLVRTVHAAGGQVYVWTVDSARRIAALEALGVDGVITNDPRLFKR
jgi:glycerophosphoryl diester phosphodiesterase